MKILKKSNMIQWMRNHLKIYLLFHQKKKEKLFHSNYKYSK